MHRTTGVVVIVIVVILVAVCTQAVRWERLMLDVDEKGTSTHLTGHKEPQESIDIPLFVFVMPCPSDRSPAFAAQRCCISDLADGAPCCHVQAASIDTWYPASSSLVDAQ